MTPPAPQRDSGRSLFLLAAATLVVFTLRPFRWILDGGELARRGATALRTLEVTGAGVQIASLVLYGATVALAFPRPGARARRLAALALVPALEPLQILVEGRHARAADVALNLAVAALAVALVDRLERVLGLRARLARRRTRLVRRLGLWALVASLAGTLVARRGVALTGWDRDLLLSVGDELCGGRSWSGALGGLALYAGDPSVEVARLARLPFPGARERRALGALHLFAGDEPGGMRDQGAARAPLDLALASGTLVREGDLARLSGAARLTSERGVGELADRARRRGALAIEVVASPPVLPPSTQARIVTASRDWYVRDLALLQEGDALLLRVRTPANGPNGKAREGRWPGAFAGGERHHFLAVFDRGRMCLFRDGALLPPDQHIYDGAAESEVWATWSLGASGAVQGLLLGSASYALAAGVFVWRRLVAGVALGIALHVLATARSLGSSPFGLAFLALAVALGFWLGARDRRGRTVGVTLR